MTIGRTPAGSNACKRFQKAACTLAWFFFLSSLQSTISTGCAEPSIHFIVTL